MQDIIGPVPSKRDEEIYEAWQSSGKTLRVLAREFSTSVMEIDLAIDRCMLPFTTATRMRAYKRENQRLENVCAHYYGKAMEGDLDSGHLYARCNERLAAINGWTSVNIRMDSVAAQAAEQLSDHEQIKRAILGMARGNPDHKPGDGNGAALAPPVAPSADDENPAN
jgi:hypothetical protein